jgi:TolB-like protein/DNA-binding winged helix-turn-helix (wHTH) protein/tetratricopeptide (TPR) repeat protein
VIRFGAFEADVRTRELRKRGVKVRLPDQPFQILALLLEHPGDVVTREDLRKRLWPADTFVDFDLSVNSAVRKLRDALGDSAEQPTFVETLPRVGYRFIAPVERPSFPASAPEGAVSSSSPLRRNRLRWAVALSALVPIALAVVGWRGAPGNAQLPQIRSIAVLPLANSSGDATQEYVVDGLTIEITNELTRFGMLTVISQNSSMQYKRTTKSVAEIAGELGVDAVVEGAAALSGQRITMTTELVHTQTGQRLWKNDYKADLRNAGELLARIARDIAAQIRTSPAAPVPARITRAVDGEAYDWFLKGLSGLSVRATGSSNPLTVASYFEKAIERAPDFADAWAGLARARTQALFAGPLPPLEVLPQVEEAAREALRLDESLVEPHLSLARVYDVYGDRAGADREALRAREVGPVTAGVIGYDVLAFIRDGRFKDAVAAARKARAIDPLDVNGTLLVARALRSVDDHDGAVAELRAALERTPGRPNIHFQLGATHVLRGNLGTGIPELKRAVNLSSVRNPRMLAYLGAAYALDGRKRQARKILEELLALRQRQYVSSFGIAFICDALGDEKEAREAIERAFQEYSVEFTQLDTYPPFEALVASPRYQQRFGH